MQPTVSIAKCLTYTLTSWWVVRTSPLNSIRSLLLATLFYRAYKQLYTVQTKNLTKSELILNTDLSRESGLSSNPWRQTVRRTDHLWWIRFVARRRSERVGLVVVERQMWCVMWNGGKSLEKLSGWTEYSLQYTERSMRLVYISNAIA